MSAPISHLFNLVILPACDPSSLTPEWTISATRTDRQLRFTSPAWDAGALSAAMQNMGVSNVQLQNLLRGNRMANGGRDPHRLFFNEQQLRLAGLTLTEAAK
jgi:hypothetical protein